MRTYIRAYVHACTHTCVSRCVRVTPNVCVSHCGRVTLSVCPTACVHAYVRAGVLAHREQVAFEVDDLLRSTFEKLASHQEAVGVHVTLAAVLMYHEKPSPSMNLAGLMRRLSATCPLDIQAELFVDTWPSL